MIKETKAQRDARIEAEMQVLRNARRAAYPQTLMSTLARAQAKNFELTVKSDLTFTLRDAEEYHAATFVVDYLYSEEADEVLEELSYEVRRKEERAEEAIRLAQARQAILNKLSKEERELLNLQ